MSVDAELGFLDEVATGAYQLEAMTTDDIRAARTIVDRYRDPDVGLADASIVVLAARHDIHDVLTLDERHFRSLRTARGASFRNSSGRQRLSPSGGRVDIGRDVEAQMARECRPDERTDLRVDDLLGTPSDFECRDTREVDGPHLMAEDHGIHGLARVTARDRYLTRIPRRPCRDGADRGHAGPMERFVRNDERPTLAGLLMTDGRIEVDDDDRPPKRTGHLGHDSVSR